MKELSKILLRFISLILGIEQIESFPPPLKKDEEIEMPDGSKWAYPVSEGVISLQNTRDTAYDRYIEVQNELTRAFNEVRDEVSMSKFGKKFADLGDAESKVITKAIPMKISEAEPRKMMK